MTESDARLIAHKFLGRRVELRRIHSRGEERLFYQKALQAHALLMLDMPAMGFLWSVEKGGNRIDLFGESHSHLRRIDASSGTLKLTESSLRSLVHPFVLERALQAAMLYYESCHLKKFREEEVRFAKRVAALQNARSTIEALPDSFAHLCPDFVHTISTSPTDAILVLKMPPPFHTEEEMQQKLDSVAAGLESFETNLEASEGLLFPAIAAKHILISKEFELESIDAAYSGNLDSMELLYDELLPTMRASITSRNKGMADKVMSALEKGEKAFCTVGAMHCVGHESIPALLKKRGATVNRISL